MNSAVRMGRDSQVACPAIKYRCISTSGDWAVRFRNPGDQASCVELGGSVSVRDVRDTSG